MIFITHAKHAVVSYSITSRSSGLLKHTMGFLKMLANPADGRTKWSSIPTNSGVEQDGCCDVLVTRLRLSWVGLGGLADSLVTWRKAALQNPRCMFGETCRERLEAEASLLAHRTRASTARERQGCMRSAMLSATQGKQQRVADGNSLESLNTSTVTGILHSCNTMLEVSCLHGQQPQHY